MKQNPGIRVIAIGIIFICLLITPAIAQDIITTKTDETIKVKIIDVTDEMVTYKEYDDRYDMIITVPISSLKLVEFVDYIPSRSKQIGVSSISSQKDSSKTSINIIPAITQDIITTKTDETIKVKIIDVTDKTITYKEYDDRYNMLITVPISSLKHIQFIDYIPSQSQHMGRPVIYRQEGSFRKFIVDGEKGYFFNDLEEYLLLDMYAKEHFKAYQTMKTTANVLGVLSLAAIPVGIGLAVSATDLSISILGALITIIGTPTLGTAGILALISANHKKNKAIDAYGIYYQDQSYLRSSRHEIPSMRLGLVSSGVGIQITF